MKRQTKETKDKKDKETKQVFVEVERIRIGDIEVSSSIYSVSQLLTLVDLALKKKRIHEYLEVYQNKKILNNGMSYLG